MKIYFFKMQAQGNDYVYVDLRDNEFNLRLKNFSDLAICFSKRHFSIGGDGLVFIDASFVADVKMIMFNSDGSRGLVCGNALRCIGYYVYSKTGKNFITVETDVGIKYLTVENDLVTVNMGQITPLDVDLEKVYNMELCAYLKQCIFYSFFCAGNNHLSVYVDNQKYVDNGLIAPLLVKTCSVFDDINVEFFTKNDDGFKVSVYERGSGKTLCCGSGAAAVYKSLIENNMVFGEKTRLDFDGGTITAYARDGDVYLSAAVCFCYQGVIYYD